ncbi:MAG: hypothetical protein H0W83_12745, partial [Planctomycetes bacterium]|nr:hypothetical protein [Planctomycetota bacterium]
MRRLIIAAIVTGSLAGCGGGSRVEVRDATTGYLVGGARIEATLRDGRSLTLGTTGNDGAARIAPPPHVDYLFVSATGYKPARAGAGDT